MPFKAEYKTQIYFLHQKGTSLSDKAVATSHYDLNFLVGRSNTNTTTTSKESSYTCIYMNIFDSLL